MRNMIFFIYYVIYCISLVGVGRCEENYFPSSDSEPKKRLIIDTDAGADDGVAILNLLGSEELFQNVEIQIITTVRGNTNVDNVARNVLKILDTMNRLDIPIYKGANQSLLITPEVENFFGEDGFGDFPYPNPPSENLIMNKHAVQAMIEEIDSHPGKLTLVCLGPLTNIALAAKLDNKLFSKLKDIYVLGGSDSGVGNIKRGVEFNFYLDPEAAFIVLGEAEKNNKTLNLVAWETAFIRSKIDMHWRKHVLGVIKSPPVDLINKAERLTLNGKHWMSSDTILSSVVIDNGLIKNSETYNAVVETCGDYSRGALFTDYSNIYNLGKNVRLIKEIDSERYKKMLLQNFNSRGGSTNGA